MPERSVLGTVLGIPPTAAVGVALAFTALGVLVDVLRIGTVGLVFKIGFFTGCVLAVAWVRRRSLFGPIVQPPLLVAITVPVIVLFVGAPGPGAGMTEKLLLVGAPLINSFPTMATTAAVVVGLGVGRILLQRNDDGLDLGKFTQRRSRPGRPGAARPGSGAGRAAADGGSDGAARGTARDGAPRDATVTRRPTGGRTASGKPRTGGASRGEAGQRRDRGGRAGGGRDTGAAQVLDELRADDEPARRPGVSARRDSDAARGAGRTSRSPRRS